MLALARHPLSDRTRAVVVQAFKRGTGLSEIARKIKVCRSEIYRIVMDERISRLSRRKMRFFDDSLFHQEDAADREPRRLRPNAITSKRFRSRPSMRSSSPASRGIARRFATSSGWIGTPFPHSPLIP